MKTLTRLRPVLLKSKENPLDLVGFLALEGQLVHELTKYSKPISQKFRSRLISLLDSPDIGTELGKKRLLNRLESAVSDFSREIVPGAVQIASKHQSDISKRSAERQKQSLKKRYISKSVQKDNPQHEALFYAKSNAMFMSSFFDETMAQRVKSEVLDAHLWAEQKISRNLKPEERFSQMNAYVSDRLEKSFGKIENAPENYWKTYSANALNNARTYSLLREFKNQESSGVVGYRIRAVIDSRTSNICLALNGRTFGIDQALDRFDSFFSASSLDEIKSISPMVMGDDKNGFSYSNASGVKTSLNANQHSDLVSGGISFPPFHFNCRSTVEPVYGMLDWGIIDDFEVSEINQDNNPYTRKLTEEEKTQLRNMERVNLLRETGESNFDFFKRRASEFGRVAAGFTPFEVSYAQAASGEYFLATSYQQGFFELNEAQLQKITGGMVIHTHPIDSTLSNSDISFAISNRLIGAAAVAKIASGRAEYWISGINNATLDLYYQDNYDSFEDFLDVMREKMINFKAFYNDLKRKPGNGKISVEKAFGLYLKKTNFNLSYLLGVVYEETKFE